MQKEISDRKIVGEDIINPLTSDVRPIDTYSKGEIIDMLKQAQGRVESLESLLHNKEDDLLEIKVKYYDTLGDKFKMKSDYLRDDLRRHRAKT